MRRSVHIERVKSRSQWDVVIIGGGASGLGIAVDAANRGYRTLLLERHDFAKGTSSRSTKPRKSLDTIRFTQAQVDSLVYWGVNGLLTAKWQKIP